MIYRQNPTNKWSNCCGLSSIRRPLVEHAAILLPFENARVIFCKSFHLHNYHFDREINAHCVKEIPKFILYPPFNHAHQKRRLNCIYLLSSSLIPASVILLTQVVASLTHIFSTSRVYLLYSSCIHFVWIDYMLPLNELRSNESGFTCISF